MKTSDPIDREQGRPNRPTERPSFFSIPEGVRNWAHVGARFWGGVLVGAGIGLVAGKGLVDLDLLAPERNLSVMVPALVLLWVGMTIAQRAVRRSRESATAQPPTA